MVNVERCANTQNWTGGGVFDIEVFILVSESDNCSQGVSRKIKYFWDLKAVTM